MTSFLFSSEYELLIVHIEIILNLHNLQLASVFVLRMFIDFDLRETNLFSSRGIVCEQDAGVVQYSACSVC